MNVERILSDLQIGGMDIACHGEDLRLSGMIENLDPQLRSTILTHKAAIRDHLALADTETYPSSPGQARLAFIDGLHPASAAYIVAAAILVEGEVDLACLRRALCETAAAHAAFRTRLERDGDGLCSAIDPPGRIVLPEVDLRALPLAETEARLEGMRRDLVTEPFDLNVAPLWRWLLVRRSDRIVELIVAIHHYIADGWSLALALRQAWAGYGRLLRGEDSGIRAPQMRYADFARNQQRIAADPRLAARLDQIKSLLDGAAHEIPFPSDRKRQSGASDRGGMVEFSLPPETCATLREFAAARRLTVGTVLSALHALAVSRFSGAERFILGIAASDRPTTGFQETFGFFVNWLPLPVDTRGDPSLGAFLERMHQTRKILLDMRDIPFDLIVRHVGVERQANTHPLFQHMMVSHVPARRIAFANARATLLPLSTGTSKLDMTLFFTDARNALAVQGESDVFLQIEYAEELYERASVESFSAAFRRLLTAALAAPETPISALPVAEPRPPASAFGPKKAAAGVSVLHSIAETACSQSEAVAVSDGASALRYGALVERATRLAAALGQAGVAPGDCVVLDHRRGSGSLVALLGILLARAVLVPLAHGVPAARLRHMIDQAGPRIILTAGTGSKSGQEWVAAGDMRPVLDLDELLLSAPDGASFSDFLAAIRPEDPAYLLFTSGSSGRPKGVLGAHGALSNFCRWLTGELRLSLEDICLCKTDFAFDASFRETLAPLVAGATVRIVSDAEALDPAALARVIGASRASVLHSTPTIYREILQAPPEDLASLRAVMLGGEVLDRDLAAAHVAAAPKARLYNVYGPTECTVDVTSAVVDPARIDRAPDIGRPIDNTTVFIAGADLAPLPQGMVGEIVIGGRALALGYIGVAEDEGRFVSVEGNSGLGRLFRTGDRGRLRGDGTLEFLGRVDRQVKVRGARVELDEIEAVLAGHSGLAAAAVTQGTDGALTAYVQPRDWPAKPDFLSGIGAHLSDRLPPYMRPARMHLLSSLPLQHGGKVDYAALRGAGDMASPLPPERPMTETEARIASIMVPYLEAQLDGPKSDFFALGGHSLNAMRVLAQINAEFGVDLTVKMFFDDATVRGLADQVAAAAAAPTSAATSPPIQRAKRPRRALHE